MEQPNRQYAQNEAYRFGFNGKENDREWGTASLTQDYGFRLYNPAIAKFLSVDPLAPSYPWNSTYAFAENQPIVFIDLDGAERAPSSAGVRYGSPNGSPNGRPSSPPIVNTYSPRHGNNISFRVSPTADKPLPRRVYENQAIIYDTKNPPLGIYSYDVYLQQCNSLKAYSDLQGTFGATQPVLSNKTDINPYNEGLYEKLAISVSIGLAETDAYKENRGGGVFFLGEAISGRTGDKHMFWGIQKEGSTPQFFHLSSGKVTNFDYSSWVKGEQIVETWGVGMDGIGLSLMQGQTVDLIAKGKNEVDWKKWSCATTACDVMKSAFTGTQLGLGETYPQPTGRQGEHVTNLMNWFKSSSKTFEVSSK